MYVWLGGAGRSHEDLARMLKESSEGKDVRFRSRRASERHQLPDVHGELIHQGAKTPCQVLEVSVGGCSLKALKPFRHGSLAPVQVVVPIQGTVLRLEGTTQWTTREGQIGVRFRHANVQSKYQLESLIAGLVGQPGVESQPQSIASAVLNPQPRDQISIPAEAAQAAPDASPETTGAPAIAAVNSRDSREPLPSE